MKKKSFMVIVAVLVIGISLYVYAVAQYMTVQTIEKGPFVIRFEKKSLPILNRVKLKAGIVYKGKDQTIVHYGEKNIYVDKMLDGHGDPISFRKDREVYTAVGHGKYMNHGDVIFFYSGWIHLYPGHKIKGHIEFDTKAQSYKVPFQLKGS